MEQNKTDEIPLKVDRFASIDVSIYDIEWNDVNGRELPSSERYSIGFETLVQNGLISTTEDGKYLFYSSHGLWHLVRDMLEDDYGAEVANFDMATAIE